MLVLHVLVENTKRVMLRMVVMIAWVVISLLVLLLLHVPHVQQVKCLLMELTPARIVSPVNMLLPLPMLAVHVLKVNTLLQLLLLVLHVQLVDIRQARMEVAVLNAPLVASKVRRAWPRVSSVLEAPTLKEQEVSCVPSAKALSTR